jgi:hypothetical protein
MRAAGSVIEPREVVADDLALTADTAEVLVATL